MRSVEGFDQYSVAEVHVQFLMSGFEKEFDKHTRYDGGVLHSTASQSGSCGGDSRTWKQLMRNFRKLVPTSIRSMGLVGGCAIVMRDTKPRAREKQRWD